MVFKATFNDISVISWRSVLLVEETGVPGEKTPSCRKTLTNFITQCCAPRPDRDLIGTDCVGSCKSNYHTITATRPLVGTLRNEF